MRKAKAIAATALIADDHAGMRQVIGAVLSDVAGLKVVGTAADGEEAVRLAVELVPNLVIMDVAMPKLDGVEATRQILSAAPATAVVAISNHDDRRLVAAMLKAGALAYVLKGDALEQLGPAVRKALRGERYLGRQSQG